MNIIEANVATPDARVAITIARFNNFINDSLLEGAIDALKRIGQVKVAQDSEIPVAFGVLTTESIEQAIERAGTKAGNKGAEAALTALEMINVLKAIKA